MSTTDFGAYRLFVLCGYFLVGLLAVIAMNDKRTNRWWVWSGFATVTAVYLLRNVLNTRSLTVLTIAFPIAAAHIVYRSNDGSRKKKLPLWKWAFLCLLAIYGAKVASNTRVLYGEIGHISPIMFDPLFRLEGRTDPNINAWFHLNGIDLMAHIAAGVESSDYAWGRAWTATAYVTIVQFFDREAVEELKTSFLASPKRYLMLQYTSLAGVDYPSCMLTDIYGNFGPMGFLPVGLLFGYLLGKATGSLWAPKSGRAIVLALFAYSLVAQFEAEFSTIAIGWLRVLPVLMPVLLLNPLRVVRLSPSAITSSGGAHVTVLS